MVNGFTILGEVSSTFLMSTAEGDTVDLLSSASFRDTMLRQIKCVWVSVREPNPHTFSLTRYFSDGYRLSPQRNRIAIRHR